ncbi:unnamed protein product [Linum tenue]|uniref:Uncharacterized protein n=1 Tax=Linum tenue TaxID=586396 RepID=A0AAV0KKI1_9ROSI|nr:unnamed protein product [Linum tenue]
MYHLCSLQRVQYRDARAGKDEIRELLKRCTSLNLNHKARYIPKSGFIDLITV